ncbi:MAG: hypothetical protein JW940_18815 [Polyangiaceae bacterium]|nr:hypothetical protein [Polyangiaceae bacterium]
MPYVGGQMDMVLVVPDSGRFAEVEARLTAAELETILDGLGHADVKLTLPKWTFRSACMLKAQLEALGMAEAFGPDADFSGMTGHKDLTISQVAHEAFVAVDEEGTEAAASTAVSMVPPSADPIPDPIEFEVDRPFVFLIRDIATGTVLFIGRVVDPS